MNLNHFHVCAHFFAQNQNGILAMLDEECLRPGTVTDETFLDKLNTICAEHQHFESRLSKNSKFLTDHSLPHNCFRIQHYAGKVPDRSLQQMFKTFQMKCYIVVNVHTVVKRMQKNTEEIRVML